MRRLTRRYWWWVSGAALATVAGSVVATSSPHPPTSHPSGLGVSCGVERWHVKTGTDQLAHIVNTTPADTTIAQVNAWTPPINPGDVRSAGQELQTWRLHATVIAWKQEADSDYHLELADGPHTMVAEIPDLACVQGSVWLPQLRGVRAAWDARYPHVPVSFQTINVPVTLTGVGFSDRCHGQRGATPPGCWELHPVLSLTFGG